MLPEMILTVSEIAAAVGGEIFGPPGAGDQVVSGASQDSRDIEPGMLFVPIAAERDGHDYIASALVAGAAAYLTEGRVIERAGPDTGFDPLAALRGSELPPAIVVTDTRTALSELGSAVRSRFEVPVVGITGSAGKTTTKDLLAAVLDQELSVHANTRSFNNELGVPLTLACAPDDVGVIVLEMGARGIGHIAALCEVAQPTVGLVTTVGLAHTSEFGSLDGVVQAKGELIAALSSDGLAVLNAGVPEVAAMARLTDARVVTFGAGGDLEAVDVSLDDELRPRFRLVGRGVDIAVGLGARGAHVVDNAAAAALVALELGVSADGVVAGLAEPVLSPLRMELTRTPSGARVLNDAYNANPMSTAAALRALARLPARRRTAVLGVMAELGDAAAAEHEAIADLAAELGIRVIAVDATDYGVVAAADIDEACLMLGELDEGDAVLVKGSRVAGLEVLVELLVGRS